MTLKVSNISSAELKISKLTRSFTVTFADLMLPSLVAGKLVTSGTSARTPCLVVLACF